METLEVTKRFLLIHHSNGAPRCREKIRNIYVDDISKVTCENCKQFLSPSPNSSSSTASRIVPIRRIPKVKVIKVHLPGANCAPLINPKTSTDITLLTCGNCISSAISKSKKEIKSSQIIHWHESECNGEKTERREIVTCKNCLLKLMPGSKTIPSRIDLNKVYEENRLKEKESESMRVLRLFKKSKNREQIRRKREEGVYPWS